MFVNIAVICFQTGGADSYWLLFLQTEIVFGDVLVFLCLTMVVLGTLSDSPFNKDHGFGFWRYWHWGNLWICEAWNILLRGCWSSWILWFKIYCFWLVGLWGQWWLQIPLLFPPKTATPPKPPKKHTHHCKPLKATKPQALSGLPIRTKSTILRTPFTKAQMHQQKRRSFHGPGQMHCYFPSPSHPNRKPPAKNALKLKLHTLQVAAPLGSCPAQAAAASLGFAATRSHKK